MKKGLFKTAIPLMLISLALGPSGCIFSPEEKIDPDPIPEVEWPDLTNHEDIVETLLLSYEKRDIDHYTAIIHPEYTWSDQDDESYGAAQDITFTGRVFDYYSSKLTLQIWPGTWTPIDEVGDEPCENCWSTLRLYEIYAQHLPEDDILHGYDNIYLIISPNPDDPGKYQLLFAKDTDIPGG